VTRASARHAATDLSACQDLLAQSSTRCAKQSNTCSNVAWYVQTAVPVKHSAPCFHVVPIRLCNCMRPRQPARIYWPRALPGTSAHCCARAKHWAPFLLCGTNII
jgi:hypothetical protein